MQVWSRITIFGEKGSIARQILFPLVLLIIASNIVIISITMQELDSQLLEAAERKLNQSSDLEKVKFTSNIRELINDVLIVSRTAPIKAIVNAGAKTSSDVRDGLSVAAWRKQLATILSEVLHFKVRYDQARLILADGSEWLRVDRYGDNGSIRVVVDDELQNKSARPYFQKAIQAQSGEVYLSDIELNREFGQVMKPERPVIRAATPLYADDGSVFGVLIINQNMQEDFDSLRLLAGDDTDVLLSNSVGEYILHSSVDKQFQFEYGRSENIVDDFPAAKSLLTDSGDTFKTGVVGEGEGQKIYSLRVINYSSGVFSSRIIVAATHDFADALRLRSQLLNKIYLVLMAISAIAILLALLIARRIAMPIGRMRDALTNHGENASPSDLPLAADGEVGDLARVFDKFIKELSSRQKIFQLEELERKVAQAELEDSNKRLIALNQEIEQFVYIASHDLQEPLRTVASFVDLLVEHNVEQQDEQLKIFHGFILESIQRMRDLVTGLLDYSRLGAESKWEEVDCQKLLGCVCNDLAARIDETHAEIHYTDLPCIEGRRTELGMLFQNLISNGIKFSRQGVTPRVHISAERSGNTWLFCVRDNGIGIKKDHFDKIFNIFQRLNNRDDFEGSGIGLAHCKKIVQMHGGNIWLESLVGEGSTFYFSLRGGANEQA
ncbi:sensor histidine kinase [Zhongshania arctica]|uniref:histidine kinase n=1 Tax=Zhongshania arctica TaxID=3238302 RepID=A0ABV3U061_9GAMM